MVLLPKLLQVTQGTLLPMMHPKMWHYRVIFPKSLPVAQGTPGAPKNIHRVAVLP